MTAPGKLSPAARAAAQAVSDRVARRLLAEELERKRREQGEASSKRSAKGERSTPAQMKGARHD
jgi:hypothetical protein